MKKITVVVTSDTHGDRQIMQIIDDRVAEKDVWLHAGDRFDDSLDIRSVKMVAVAGNVDAGHGPAEQIIELAGNRILLVHGHQYGVKAGLLTLAYRARERAANLVVFGHTHQRLALEQDGIFFFNPGSPFHPKDGKGPGFGLLTFDENGFTYEWENL